ncbi:MAG: CPBP family glutamic-type intramembrane protease [Candidatus Binatia bacterium]|nr:CPBP family glutamic-type intramembrane protease [Candidatus Binatia bacterium]
MRIIRAVITVPIAEELAFRTYLARRVQDRQFWNGPLARFLWLTCSSPASGLR